MTMRALFSFTLAATLLTSCGGGGDSTTPSPVGSLVAKTVTVGAQLDPNGYTLTSTALGGAVPIGINTTLRKDELPPGSYPATLSGLASNCHASTLTDTGHVVEAGIDTIAFVVTCDTTFGTIVVLTNTSGALPDSDGYFLQVGGGGAVPLQATGATVPLSKPAGLNALSLSGVGANCIASPGIPANVIVTAGVTDTLSIDILCDDPVLVIQQELSAADGILRIDLYGAMSTLLLPEAGGATFSRPAWSPDGTHIVFDQMVGGHHGIGILAADSAASWLLVADSGDTFKPRWRPDGGALLVVRQADTSLYRLTLVAYPSGTLTPITPDTLQVGSGDWSPDGSRIVFTASLPHFDTQYLFVMQADGSGLSQINLPPEATPAFQPRWSPAGDRILFSVNAEVDWTVGPDGSSPMALHAAGYRTYGIGSWDPTGSSIVVAAQDSSSGSYVLLRLLPTGTVRSAIPVPTGAWENPDLR